MEVTCCCEYGILLDYIFYLWWKTIKQFHIKNKTVGLLLESEMFSTQTTPPKVP